MKLIKQFLPAIIFLFCLLLFWEGIIAVFGMSTRALPSPSAIIIAYGEHADILWVHIGQTLLETVIGLVLAVIAGVGVAVLLHLSLFIRRTIYPLLVISQTVPIIALAPLLLIWFGFTLFPKILVVMLFCFFPIAISFFDGMQKVNPQVITLLQSMGATRLQILRFAEFPGALPSFFSGLKLAATYSVTAAIVGEYVGGYQGLGIYMQSAAHSYAVTLVFVTIVITSLLSMLLFGLVFLLEYFFLPWHRKEK